MPAFSVAATALVLAAAQPAERTDVRPLQPVPFTSVRLTGGLLAQRQDAGATGTLEQNFSQCEETGRIANFARAAGKEQGKHEGYFFNDSDVYKAIEGAADILARTHDQQLDRRLDQLIQLIAAAQRPDGYIYTYYQLGERGGLDSRWTNLKDMHELYCAGHLIEAAVAHHRATGKRNLLDVAIKLADHIDSVFGPHEGARKGVCGHEEIELALLKLADLTGDQKYSRLAQHFIALRGDSSQRETWGEYCQDHLPVRQHDHIVGHAVRAMYLYSAVADIAMRTDDRGYSDAMERVWEDLTQRKMYVTGGIGTSSANEGFTTAYDLPNDTAYAETCAAIGLVFWSHRLSLLHADAKYVDVLERALYNSVLSGVSLDGRRFLYENPLASRGRHHRQPWYDCACCPPNILRLMASIGGYVYAQSDDAVYINLYTPGTAEVTRGAAKLGITQATDYPWDGRIRITLEPNGPVPGTDICLRLPGWVTEPDRVSAAINGQQVRAKPERGYIRLKREWRTGDTIALDLPMPIERVVADPRVKADQGRVALQRGPIVFCVESIDNTQGPVDGHVRALVLPPQAPLEAEFRPDLLGGVTAIHGRAVLPGDAIADEGEDSGRRDLYRPARSRTVEFTAIPYFAWDNRPGNRGEMVVWLPESESLAERPLDATISVSASHCFSSDTLEAMYDTLEPGNSSDHSIPRFTWWPRKGSTEWVQYDFARPRRISATSVYWFDDTPVGGGCRVPEGWKVLYRVDDQWREAEDATPAGTNKDAFNRVTFKPVRTTGLRLEVKLKPDASSGILEWKAE